jgi:S-DNA-T family DNA segregation ATPase FtsK/SpoIIIE
MPDQKEKNGTDASGFRFRHVFYVIVIILLFLALFSYNASDLQVLEGGSDAQLKNWIGPAGAHFSRLAFYLFGLSSYPLLIFLTICSARPMLSAVPTKRRGYFGALLAIAIGTTILFGMFPGTFSEITESLGIGTTGENKLSNLSGGVFGQLLAAPEQSVRAGLISRYIGSIGTFIIGFTFLLSGLLFVWFADWKDVLAKRLEERKKIKAMRGDEDTVDSMREKRLKEQREKFAKMLEEAEKTPSDSAKDRANEENYDDSESISPALSAPKKDTVSSALEEEDKKIHAPTRKKVIKNEKKGQSYHYELPPISLLEKGAKIEGENVEIIEMSKRLLQETLDSFKIEGKVVASISGPRVTRYEILLAPGVKVQRVTEITNNLAMQLEAESIRILAPIPGKNTIGVEIPNSSVSTITLRSIMETDAWLRSKAEIPIILGRDVAGKAIVTDLAKAPHMLIAGATGSGKSVCMHSILLSMLYKFSPIELRFILVDPKMVEFSWYKPLPHLNVEVVNDAKKVPRALRWGVNEMERRYKLFSELKARNLTSFNSRQKSHDPERDSGGNEIPDSLPYVVIIIDELADIMMTEFKNDVEISIARIAQKGRAAGIHMVIATQTPRVQIITGAIKANIPTRIALQVSSQVDSRVIIDGKGAETLLGKGDMLFTPPGSSAIDRIQGTFIQDHEIENVVRFVTDQVEQIFDERILLPDGEESGETGKHPEIAEIVEQYLKDCGDQLLKQSLEIILTDKKASTSYLQRRLKVGYNKAAELIEALEKRGIVGPAVGASAKRDILVEGYEDAAEKKDDDE